MNMPFYVSPEQQVKDRADFARQGIARGRSVAVLRYTDGICFVAENPSRTLRKISEIYDRIGFAGVGRYHEFERLRVAGIQTADLRGYAYDRADVTARSLVNTYTQVLGGIFSSAAEKPFEVEIAVAEIGQTAAEDHIFKLSYDGSVVDENGFTVMGGSAETIAQRLGGSFDPEASLADAVRTAVRALSGSAEPIPAHSLEAAVLDRTHIQRRKFVRLSLDQLNTWVAW